MEWGPSLSDMTVSEMKTHLDLFSGIGGFALGLSKVCEFKHTFVEYEKHLQNVLKKNFPDSTIYGDIESYKPNFSPWVITGGFPCQDISRANMNKNKGGINGERSGLWKQYFRVIRESTPKYVIIENVYDLLSNGLGVILQDMAEIGYDTAWTVIDSQYTGVPQRRRRVYILGVRDGITRGSDIFKCNERSVIRQQIANIEKGRNEEIAKAEKSGKGFFAFQRSDEYKSSGVASTIKKCGWAIGGDIIVSDGVSSYLTAKEKLKLQGIDENHTSNCGLDSRQLHTANGMTIQAVSWVAQKLIDYDKGLDI
jgi:DNA (cytosine-5)-methyltransferase 1